MDVYYDGYYRMVRKNLSRIGLWADDDPNFRIIRKSYFSFILLTSICLQTSEFATSPFNMRLLYKFTIRISPSMFSSIFYCWMMYKEKTLTRIFHQIRVDFLLRTTEERRLVESYAKHTRNYIFLIIYTYSIFLIVLIAPDILSTLKLIAALNQTVVRKYPFSIGYSNKFQSYYFVTLIPLYVILLTEMAITIGTWNTYIHFMHHICAMFRVAGNMLERALSEKKVKFNFDKNETRNALARVINYHNDCIRFVNDINSISDNIFLLELVLAIIIICTDVLYLIDVKYSMKEYNEFLLYTIYIGCHLILLCGSCHFGQSILDHGLNFNKKTYTVAWYITPPTIRKMCLLIMTKSTKPLHFSIGKMFVLSYDLLATVLNTSISYAMVFRSLSIKT